MRKDENKESQIKKEQGRLKEGEGKERKIGAQYMKCSLKSLRN